jgi:hypothetical protein
MRHLLDRTKEEVRALKTLKCPTEHWEDILVFLTLKRLDAGTCPDWQLHLTTTDDDQRMLVNPDYTPTLLTFNQLDKFLESLIRTLEMSSPETKSQSFVNPFKKVLPKAQVHAIGASPRSFSHDNSFPCAFCAATPAHFTCETFRSRSPTEWLAEVLRLKLCLNCLGHHMTKDCSSTKTCRTCGNKHNTLLHDTASSDPGPAASVHLARPMQKRRIVLLATAQVIVRSPRGQQIYSRALLDSGSETSLVAEHVVQQLLRFPLLSSRCRQRTRSVRDTLVRPTVSTLKDDSLCVFLVVRTFTSSETTIGSRVTDRCVLSNVG